MPRNTRKFGLLAGCSALALGIGLAAAPVKAFDEVNWTWDATVTETITKTVVIDIDVDLDSMTMVELVQLQVGDVTASSTVTDVDNNQPTNGSSGGTQTVDLGNLQFTGNYNPGTGTVTGDTTASVLEETEFLAGVVNTGSPFGVTMNYDLGTIEVTFEPEDGVGPFDAETELASIVSSATAVGNNANISSTDAAVQLHVMQAMTGEGGSIPTFSGEESALLAFYALTGSPATVSATSMVSNISNASVDSAATAVANNINVASTGTVLMADLVQVSHANVSATSDVSNVAVSNYFNLAAVNPIVSSVATAVGNNANVSVSAPVVAAP
jgi:hypothetical protein